MGGVATTSRRGVRRRRPTRMIATPGTRIGKLAGRQTRRNGVVRTRRWVAQKPHPSLTIVTQVILIGRLGGAMTRRVGVAPTRRRVASTELADASASLCSAVFEPYAA